ncbi:c-type cytochrome [Thiorhodococcus fuscus]|uniref:C-type cytochrome n=1 Tax=Thiorhodococcus fuscus TaxID=527200 RepID=A0ABW4YA46_9GAMM
MNQLKRLMLPVVFCCSMPAQAETPLGQRLATQGDPNRGIPACSSCHGPEGSGNEAIGSARLAGQSTLYLQRQIENFRDGRRANPLMRPWAEQLTPAERVAVSDYYAALAPVGQTTTPTSAPNPAIGTDLALFGDWPDRKLPSCIQCHGPSGQGVGANFPALAGQPYSYLLNQLTAWAQGTRSGDPLGMMQHVASRLTEDEMRSVAAYFAAQLVASTPEGIALNAPDETSPGAALESLPAPSPTSTGLQSEHIPNQDDIPAGRAPDTQGYFKPPSRHDRPEGPFGEMVALGEAIFTQTDTHPESAPHVGNGLTCRNCHLDAGRLANAAPMWAAWVSYPAYRAKSNRVDTLTSRLQGCFSYSMNAQDSVSGIPPDADSKTIVALLSYVYWLATGAPTGDRSIPGRGFSDIEEPAEGYDAKRGATLYRQNCAICHGARGAGTRKDDIPIFPPLWGPKSYNWGAGMHALNTAAAFIRHNMPLGGSIELTDQDAWDLSAFINSQERPQDPRFTGDLAETAQRYHGGRYDLYGTPSPLDGHRLGEGTPATTSGPRPH